ncbi:MAG: hypothetical protein ABI402_08600 [Ferruginibacter sp.]
MRYSLFFISALFISLFPGNFVFAQVSDTSILKIQSRIKYTDSFIINNPEQFYRRGISGDTDSLIKSKKLIPGYYEGMSEVKGAWSLYTFQKEKGDTIYTISYHDNFLEDFYLTFYFNDNVLLYSKLEYQKHDLDTSFCKREEYYRDGKITLSTHTTGKIDEIYRDKIDTDLFSMGNKYLQVFLKNGK